MNYQTYAWPCQPSLDLHLCSLPFKGYFRNDKASLILPLLPGHGITGKHGMSHILVSLEILAVLGVQWDLALQELQGLLPHQAVQVALDPPSQPAPLGDPEHQPVPADLSLPADLQTVAIHFCIYVFFTLKHERKTP